MKNLKLGTVEHHWCSIIPSKTRLSPQKSFISDSLKNFMQVYQHYKLDYSTDTQLSRIRVLKPSCHLISSFSLKNSHSIVTSKHIQHSSWPESGLHLCFPSSRLSRHTLQTSQWNDLSLWILFKTKNKKSFWKIDWFSSVLSKWNSYR